MSQLEDFKTKVFGCFFRCWSPICKGKMQQVKVLKQFEHDEGLKDIDGKTYWVYFACSCGMRYSHEKLPKLIALFEGSGK